MDKSTLFTASKWDILRSLGTGKKSPAELAQATNTSIANISQQLRLLELAGFVTAERIANRDKGKPRILYALSGNHGYFVLSAPGLVEKKFMEFDERQKATLRVWFLDNPSVRYAIEKTLFVIDDILEEISCIALPKNLGASVTLHIIADASLAKKLKPVQTTYAGQKISVQFQQHAKSELKKFTSKEYHIIYDPLSLTTDEVLEEG